MKHVVIPGGVSPRTGRQAVFFTVVNPMDNQELVTSKNRAVQKYLKTLSKYSMLVQFEAR